MLPPTMPKEGNTMNAITTPSPLTMPAKRVEHVNRKRGRGQQVTAKVNDGQPAWVSRTPIGKQDESPMFKHVVVNGVGEVVTDVEHTYLGTRLIVTKGKTGTRSQYMDLYYDEFEMRVIARWSNQPEDVTIGCLKHKAPGVDAALKIAKRKGHTIGECI